MKIAVVSSAVFPCPPAGYSGLEFIAWLTAKGLAEKGHTVSLIAPEGSTCPGVEIISMGPAGQVNEQQAFQNYHQHLFSCDIIIDHSWQKFSYLLRASRSMKALVLGVLHAPVHTMYQSPPPVENPCFVAISEDQAMRCFVHLDRKAKVVYNGISGEFYRPISIPKSDRYLFLARFSSIKGPHLAIEACLEAGVGLDLVGDTSITNEPEYFQNCQKMCDGKQIRMVGPASRGECVWWFSQAKALLHPVQMFNEPFGLSPVESQLCCCPVLSWNRGAMRETIKEGVTGFLVNSKEQMVSLLKNNSVANLDPLACRQWASQFSVERMVDGYEALAKEALTTGGW